MGINTCPIEVLDAIFEACAVRSPKTGLLPVLLTCRHFHDIGARLLYRQVSITNRHQLVSFDSALEKLRYRDKITIRHLFVVDKDGSLFGDEAWEALERVIKFAAPTLRTLTTHSDEDVSMSLDRIPTVPISFPQLEEFTSIGRPLFQTGSNPVTMFPLLKRVYLECSFANRQFLQSYPLLKYVRLDMLLQPGIANIPSTAEASSWGKLTIDVGSFLAARWDHQMRWTPLYRSNYDTNLANYHELAQSKGEDGFVLVAGTGEPVASRYERFMEGWVDRICGGHGWWCNTWKPTISKDAEWDSAVKFYDVDTLVGYFKSNATAASE